MTKFARSIAAAALPAVLILSAGLVTPGCRAKGSGGPQEGSAAPASERSAAPDSVTLTPEAIGSADIKTVEAEVRTVGRRITAVGEIEWNARRLVHLTSRTAGRLERVLVVRGDRVRPGQVLAEIHSPDWLALQAEYLQAAARAQRHAGDPQEGTASRAFLAGARERLLLLGASAPEIEALDASAPPQPLLAVRAPFGGTVLESAVVTGDAVELGSSLFRLADPSMLWAALRIQEKDVGAAKAGAEVVLTAQALPGEEFRGRLVLVGDVVDPATRTVEGRVEVANASGRLRPGMYVEGTAAAGGERPALVVPEASVQDDDGRPIVFVRTGERTFTRRAVKAGPRFAGTVEILEGLAAGEPVVTSGSFLLKSELRKGSLGED